MVQRLLMHFLILTGLLLPVALPARAEERGDVKQGAGAPSTDLTELSIEDLMSMTVYGASKFDQKLTEAPSSVTIIAADEIRKYGYRTLADIVRSASGFYTTYDRNYTYIGVRGFNRPIDYGSRVLLLVDGHRINNNILNTATIGTDFPVDVDLIDRVEIIRGPGSSLYGSNAFFAVINVITKRGRDLRGTEIAGEAASFDTYEGRLSYGDKFQNGLEALMSGSGYDSKGQRRLYFKEFDSPAANNGITEDSDYGKSQSLFSKFSFNDFTLEGVYVTRTKGIPTGFFGTVFDDPRNRTVDEHAYLDLQYAHTANSRLNIAARIYFDQFYAHGQYVTDLNNLNTNPVNPLALDVSKILFSGSWWGGDAQVNTTFLEKHKVTAGVAYRKIAVKRVKSRGETVGCHILFISSTEEDRIEDILLSLKGSPVLVVG